MLHQAQTSQKSFVVCVLGQCGAGWAGGTGNLACHIVPRFGKWNQGGNLPGRLQTDEQTDGRFRTISGMASIPELLNGHVTLEVECVDRMYLNGYIGKLATGPGLVMFMKEELGKPVSSPAKLGQMSEKFREAVKELAECDTIPVHQFEHARKERKDEVANDYRRRRKVRDGIVFIGVAQEKAQAFSAKKVNGWFEFNRDKTVYVNHYYFYIDDEDFGPYSSRCAATRRGQSSSAWNGHEWAKSNWKKEESASKSWTTDSCRAQSRSRLQLICDGVGTGAD